MRVLRLSIVCMLIVAGGCGFHLRGSRPVDIGVARAYVTSSGADLLAAELRRRFAYSGVNLAGSAASAGLIVQVSQERFRRRVLSVDAVTGKVREFELDYEARLDVRRPDGTAIIEDQPIQLERDFTFDETAVLGSFEQQTLLEQELREDAAEALLHRLEALDLD